MIVGMKNKSEVELTLESLSTSTDDRLKFYLTGSRYFGNPTDESDWDFFCQDSIVVRNFLIKLGFETYYSHSEGYSPKDTNTATILSACRNKIQVQLQHDVNVKVVAQNLLARSPLLLSSAEKGQRRIIWNFAMNVAKDIMGREDVIKSLREQLLEKQSINKVLEGVSESSFQE